MIQANNPKSIMAALHEFGPAPGAKKMLEWESTHAKEALASGMYIVFSNLAAKSECFRVGSQSLCLCGHLFGDHAKAGKGGMKMACQTCSCKNYKFMFRRPEEQGLWWLPRRKGFDINKWRATCQCKHNHEAHDPNTLKCNLKCGCFGFQSEFPCLVCDKKWEDHDVLYETREERRALKKPVDEGFLPLSKNPDIQHEYAKKIGEAPLDEDDKALEEAKTHHLASGMMDLDLTPDLPPGMRGRGIEVHMQMPKPTGTVRPKQPVGKAEKSVKLMEMKGEAFGGYSATNVKKEIKKEVKKELKKEVKKTAKKETKKK